MLAVITVCVVVIALAVAPVAVFNLLRLVEMIVVGVLYLLGMAFPIWFFGSLFFWGF